LKESKGKEKEDELPEGMPPSLKQRAEEMSKEIEKLMN